MTWTCCTWPTSSACRAFLGPKKNHAKKPISTIPEAITAMSGKFTVYPCDWKRRERFRLPIAETARAQSLSALAAGTVAAALRPVQRHPQLIDLTLELRDAWIAHRRRGLAVILAHHHPHHHAH